MTIRICSRQARGGLAWGALPALFCSLLQATAARAQELPRSAIVAAVQHVASTANSSVAVAVDRFPDPAVARASAESLGARAGALADFIRCDATNRACRNVSSRAKVISFQGYTRSRDSLTLALVVSTEHTDRRTGTKRLARVMKMLVLVPSGDGWRVAREVVGPIT